MTRDCIHLSFSQSEELCDFERDFTEIDPWRQAASARLGQIGLSRSSKDLWKEGIAEPQMAIRPLLYPEAVDACNKLGIGLLHLCQMSQGCETAEYLPT